MATKEDIKLSALHFFAYKGYEGTTMQDIANSVGLKKQSLYSHFECKETLYLTVLREQGRAIYLELSCAVERLKNKPSEEFLKGLFASLAETFSVRERLLFWKRTFIHYGSQDNTFITDPSEWHFDGRLKEALYEVLSRRHVALADDDVYRAFFISYMLMIQGYLDWMIVMGHDEPTWQSVWSSFWIGAGKDFKDENV